MFSVNFYSIKVTEIDENANNVGLTKETFDKMLFKPFDSGDFCK